jgi:Cu+-exporting ATPase
METHEFEKTYEIKGMTCAACVGRVEKVLRRIPNVKDVAVNLATERARVVFATGVPVSSDEVIFQAVKKTGYSAKLHPETESFGANDLATSREASRSRLRLMLAILFTTPLMLPMFFELTHTPYRINGYAQAVFAGIVQFGLGAHFYRGAFYALRSKSPNMDVLVVLGTFSAYALSFYFLLQHGEAHPHFYFETGALVTTLVMLGKYLENQAKTATGEAIQKLKAIRPAFARVLNLDQVNSFGQKLNTEIVIPVTHMTPLTHLKMGDVIRVLAGEVIPADGRVVRGKSEVNESLLTGESLPVMKIQGALVSGGSLNSDGVLDIEIIGTAGESLLSRMITLIERAQEKKAPIQRLADRISAVFVPIVLVLAALTLLFWGLIAHQWEAALMHSVGVLVIACPCALGLATPTAVRVGMGAAARHGILIKDAEVLETLHSLTEVAFDKTGTLTAGNFSLIYLRAFSESEDGMTLTYTAGSHQRSEFDFLKIIASLQSQSEHPLAKSVLNRAEADGVKFSVPEEVRAIPGEGIEGKVDGIRYFFGQERAVWTRSGAAAHVLHRAAEGETVSYLLDVDSNEVIAIAGFMDEVRPEAKAAVARLHADGIESALLSGDRSESANRIGQAAGIKEILGELSPEEKTNYIRSKIDAGIKIGMVGDGLNDGPALATASVGFAMVGATDVSMSVAGVTLMRPDLNLIPESIQLSKLIYHKIRQNLFWAFAYNVLGIPLAAMGYLNPMIAGAAMALSSVSVVLNSLSLVRSARKLS